MKDGDSFDFKKTDQLPESFPADYLRQYYGAGRPVSDDEIAVYRFIRSISDSLTGHEQAIEVGCGPTMHHAIMLAPYVASITMSDYLEQNLEFVQSWLDRGPWAWDWNEYTARWLKEDGVEPQVELIEQRENIARQKVSGTLPVNLLEDHPLDEDSRRFDLVASFYCTEEVALTVPRWHEVMKSVCSLVKPGGHILMSFLRDSDFYHLCSEQGEVRELPCARITESDLRNTLTELGFEVNENSIQAITTPTQDLEGIPGILLTFARKV